MRTHNIPGIPAGQSLERPATGALRAATLLLAALFLSSGGGARAAAPARPLALADDETLVYRVSWALLPSVGEIRVSAKAATGAGGDRLMRIVTTTRTRGLAYLLLPFEARAESLFDIDSGRLIRLGESSSKRGRTNSHTVFFDYARDTAAYATQGQPAGTRLLAMPRGYPTDLITSLLEARAWDMRPGGTHEALVLFEDDFYQLTIHALDYERVVTPLGTFTTLVLEPRMERTPPKGMFKRGSTVRVWISQGPQQLPVRFQVEFKIGAGTATLVEYHPPTAPGPAAARP